MKFSLENLFEFRQLIKHLSAGLKRLTLNDNLEGTEITLTIGSGLELRVRNPLSFVPSRYIILSKTGNSTISKSSTWTADYLYFTNHGSESTDATVFLMR